MSDHGWSFRVLGPRLPMKFDKAVCRTALLSLGSNLDAEKNLRSAARALRDRFGAVAFSPVYRVPAVGFEGPDFLNAAARVETELQAVELDAWLHALEDAHGRRRDVPRFSSRTLDIDLVLLGDLVMRGPGHLQLPRPDIEHAFVLKPLCDLAPEFPDPRTREPLAELWARHPDHGRGLAPSPIEL